MTQVVKKIEDCEAGSYFSYKDKVFFLSHKDIVDNIYVKHWRTKFEEGWPTVWAELQTIIPECPNYPFTECPAVNEEQHLVNDPGDLYWISKYDLLQLDGIQDTLAEKLLLSISQSKSKSLGKVLVGLGIKGINREWGRKLAVIYPSIWHLATASWENLLSNSGLGGSLATSVSEWVHSESSWKIIMKLRAAGVDSLDGYPQLHLQEWPELHKCTLPEYVQKLLLSSHPRVLPSHLPSQTEVCSEKKEPVSLIKDKTFMFTGRLLTMTRDEAQKAVEEKGGIAGNGVTSNTDYLVVGDTGARDSTNKLMLAKLHGTKVLTEDELLTMLED